MAGCSNAQSKERNILSDDIGEREAEVYLEMLRVLTRGLLVLGALGGAGITASQLGLV